MKMTETNTKWKKLIYALEAVVEETEWDRVNVAIDEGLVELWVHSPAGEEHIFECELDFTTETDVVLEIIRQLKETLEAFDPDSHAISWYGSDRGEPKSLRVLLDDAEWYEALLKESYQQFSEQIHSYLQEV